MRSRVSDEELDTICQHAEAQRRRRGDIIFCTYESPGNPPKDNGPYSNDLIQCACTGTRMRYTGHSSLDAEINVDRMYQCPYRKTD